MPGRFGRSPDPALLAEIADRLRGLLEKGLLTAVTDEGGRPTPDPRHETFLCRAWFAMTAEGRRLWAAADPAAFVERK